MYSATRARKRPPKPRGSAGVRRLKGSRSRITAACRGPALGQAGRRRWAASLRHRSGGRRTDCAVRLHGKAKLGSVPAVLQLSLAVVAIAKTRPADRAARPQAVTEGARFSGSQRATMQIGLVLTACRPRLRPRRARFHGGISATGGSSLWTFCRTSAIRRANGADCGGRRGQPGRMGRRPYAAESIYSGSRLTLTPPGTAWRPEGQKRDARRPRREARPRRW